MQAFLLDNAQCRWVAGKTGPYPTVVRTSDEHSDHSPRMARRIAYSKALRVLISAVGDGV